MIVFARYHAKSIGNGRFRWSPTNLSGLNRGREKEEEREEEENLDFFPRHAIRRPISLRRAIHRSQVISSPRVGIRNISPSGENERGDIASAGSSPTLSFVIRSRAGHVMAHVDRSKAKPNALGTG
ncbi:hypothetical protein BHE74_00057697 [Ensete ventricosum]|nr:hypothetical protein BHE74_00057697 [Ensete ventricosum]RZS27604.1 hypothetical protein BHM03_00061107 [Ensete ventricosum]